MNSVAKIQYTTKFPVSRLGRQGSVSVRAVARPQGAQQKARKFSTTGKELKLYSSAVPVVSAIAAGGIAGALQPAADYFNTLGLPEWLIHWGHPANMTVVLFAMGGYGSWLGWQIRVGDDEATIEKAVDLHPKLMVGMGFFFALGASGGMLSLLMQGKPIFNDAHVWTGLGGLSLLALQGMLALFFEDDPNARTAHAFFGTGVMALFVVHAFLGLQLGLSI
uniref:Uncharacterized protein n=2 Tax=Tetraselmis sp. GSL018 TaxID=582737 RepID=A0A061S7Q6_9CHLO|mmetsp:Transcript_30282/g.72048  ORF Transcript_30282/g.72048 Transcript_30282/m.72048 type:complete len:221 (-) Transcript_30282:236-898(-)|eukprot:CAMPEP_0177600928 /NCGR_PEP_ID=MMETSP0419_2-20121207/13943_1 /TAXON_ID=582737 /ORGANISM="Tetraselmis sp., Strain GSL018" /LENGTH=220 /DNA_ID=CAMNT_0019094071 /DNA_START=60 /DNA_END=722 /DNA_ORIENTATION=-